MAVDFLKDVVIPTLEKSITVTVDNDISKYSLSVALAFGLAIGVLLFGRLLTQNVGFLKKFCVPAPVVGGLIFALLNLLAFYFLNAYITFDNTLQSFFMLCFFTTVGFQADMKLLKKAGIGVILFLILATTLCIVQNAVGVSLASLLGQNPLLGIATGSVPLTGGHGTSGAFGKTLEEAGLIGGNTIALAAATFGLVAGSLIGGPIGRSIIERRKLKQSHDVDGVAMTDILTEEKHEFNTKNLSEGFFQIALAVGIGAVVSILFDILFKFLNIQFPGFKMNLPIYIGAMLVAATMTNLIRKKGKKGIKIKEITALGDIFLATFLAYALMSLKLWELADLALPMIIILAVQVVIMGLFAYFITFKVMGSNYDAAVLSAGHCGFGMGATPNGVANMTSVVERYFPSTRAFIILPIVGGMFIDFTNAFIITLFIGFFQN